MNIPLNKENQQLKNKLIQNFKKPPISNNEIFNMYISVTAEMIAQAFQIKENSEQENE